MKCFQSKKSGMIRRLAVLWSIAYDGIKGYGAVKNVLWLIYAVFDFLAIFMLQRVYDTFGNAEQNIKGFIQVLLLFGATLLVNELMLAISNVVTEDSCYLLMKNLGKRLHWKVNQEASIKFEQDEYLNRIQQAKSGIESGTFLLNVLSMVGFYHIPYLIFVGAYLIYNQPILIMMLFLIAIPIIINQWIKMKEYDKIVDDSGALEREYSSYQRYVQDVEYFKETRLLQAFSYFHRLFRDTVQSFNRIKLKTAGKMCRWGIAMQIISLLGYLGTVVLMIALIYRGYIKVSVFFAILTSFSSVFALVENLLGYYFGQISEKSGSVNHLLDFLLENEEDERKAAFDENVKRIELRGIEFSYPNVDTPIFQNISCTFNEKETIAIVGENGAGKTTLVKLLAGIYEPQKGQVFYNDKNIADYTRKSIWDKASAVFQNFRKYKMSLWDNLFPGEYGTADMAEINMRRVNMPVNEERFPQGYDTMMSQDFGGIDLSGGQWQKLAIVRAMNKNHEILFLDEPTSAIDPEEEHRLYKLFGEMSEECISFIVTHRLGICKIVDRIIVLDKGKIVEDGTHEELLRIGGKYAEMYEKQAGLYERNEKGEVWKL